MTARISLILGKARGHRRCEEIGNRTQLAVNWPEARKLSLRLLFSSLNAFTEAESSALGFDLPF